MVSSFFCGERQQKIDQQLISTFFLHASDKWSAT